MVMLHLEFHCRRIVLIESEEGEVKGHVLSRGGAPDKPETSARIVRSFCPLIRIVSEENFQGLEVEAERNLLWDPG